MLDTQFGHLMPQENRTQWENSSLQLLQEQALPFLELPKLLECAIQDFLSSSHKNKAKQKFKVLF